MYYEFVGDLKKALESHKDYSSLYRTLFEQKQANKIQELQERFESKQKLSKIQELTEGNMVQKEVISSQLKRINTRNWLLLICFVLIILAIVVYFLIQQRHKTKEKILEVHRLESIFKEQEIVKEKISKDLHDIIITSFDAIRLKILALSKADNPDIVSKSIVREIVDVNEQIRLISHRLSPLGDKVKDSKLTEIILNQLTEFQYYRKVFVDIQLPLPSTINNFTLASQTNLYGIILEVLNNIEKYAQATEIKITHYKEKDYISLSICDNGIGFQNKDKNGVGLINMKQRAELLKGTCTIDSSDKGTTISVKFPITVNLE
jgi:signal transduction histidine kinase